jgi:hypothetical protein
VEVNHFFLVAGRESQETVNSLVPMWTPLDLPVKGKNAGYSFVFGLCHLQHNELNNISSVSRIHHHCVALHLHDNNE